MTSPEIYLAKINVAKKVLTLARETILLNWLTRINKGRRIRGNSILGGKSRVCLFYFLYYVIFFLIFNHAMMHTKVLLFSRLLIAELLRERYVTVLGKELPSEESRALKCCAPNLSKKKNPGTHNRL